MKELHGVTRIAFLAFFASHIPITLMVDGQALLPRSIYPEFAVRALDWYTETFSDPLMKRPQLWFQSMVACEFLFQLPFFVVAVIALLNPGTVDGSGWFKKACLCYGVHTSTTLVPILASFTFDASLSRAQVLILFSFYLPYLMFPLWLVFIALQSDDIFGKESEDSRKRKDHLS